MINEEFFLTEAMKKYITATNEKWGGSKGRALVNRSVALTINTGEGNRRCDASNYLAYGYPNDSDIKGEDMAKVRIRRLTPKECWRLMDFPDEAYEKAAQVNSNTQLYKQAGNSIVVACLEHIFRNLFSEQTDEPIEEEPAQTIEEEPKELTLWDLI